MASKPLERLNSRWMIWRGLFCQMKLTSIFSPSDFQGTKSE
ncbi:hypothetical protein TRICHSKD4_3300 [Roseibium sp. TrichSKD4]|nr:hypothetical protein TRICHSKD4_3300 [Roseibium sp. TrichSKD4]